MKRTLIHKSQFARTYLEESEICLRIVKKFPGHVLRSFNRPLYLGEGEVRLQSGREAVESEISCLRSLQKAVHIVTLVDVLEISDHSLELVFEFAGRPVLRWIGNGFERISDPRFLDVREILRQTLLGVSEIHSAGIVHKDLKEQNILANFKNDRFVIAICDFGSACFVDRDSPVIHDAQGTLEYTPPEILLHGKGDGFKRDLWSIGIFFFALLTLRLPWAQRTEAEIIATEISRPLDISDSAWELLHGLTTYDPNLRWSGHQALAARYFSDL